MITIPALCLLHPNSNLLPPLRDPTSDLSQDGHKPCHSCRICREQWMNPGQTNPPPAKFLFPVAFGAVFPQENPTGEELSSQVDSDLWMSPNCPWGMSSAPGDGARDEEPALNPKALPKLQQDHSICPSRENPDQNLGLLLSFQTSQL